MGRGGASIRMEVGAGFFAEDQGRKWAAAGCARAGSGAGSRCGHRFGAAESAGLGLRVPRGRGELVVDVVHLRDNLGELRLLEDERKRRLRRPPRAAVADGDHAETQRPQRAAERISRLLPMLSSDGDLPRRWMVSKERVGTVGE